jgi:hypothetical protein
VSPNRAWAAVNGRALKANGGSAIRAIAAPRYQGQPDPRLGVSFDKVRR